MAAPGTIVVEVDGIKITRTRVPSPPHATQAASSSSSTATPAPKAKGRGQTKGKPRREPERKYYIVTRFKRRPENIGIFWGTFHQFCTQVLGGPLCGSGALIKSKPTELEAQVYFKTVAECEAPPTTLLSDV